MAYGGKNVMAADRLLLPKVTRHAVSAVNVTTGTTFKANEADPSGALVVDCSLARFVHVYSDVDVLVERGDSVTNPATPGTGSFRVIGASPGVWFQNSSDGTPWVTVKSVSGTAAVAINWGW